MLTHDSPTLHRLEYEYDGTFPVYNPGTGGVSGVNFPRYQRSVKIVDIFINKTATGDSITLPPVAVYILEYSFVQLKHGHSFIGFKSWCPTINAFGNCLRSSRNRASREPRCSSVRVSFGQQSASSPPS